MPGRRRSSRRELGRARALVRYFRDPSASVVGKLLVLLAAAYVAWPADLLPDVPLVGWLDDLGVAGLAAAWLGRVSARYRALPAADDDVHAASRGDAG